MGAEQSALLACTETGKPEKPLRLYNSEQFFQLYFDGMPEPRTGPVTAALLHLIMNMPPSQTFDQDSGFEIEEMEMEESDEESDDERDHGIYAEQLDASDASCESGLSMDSISTESNAHNDNSSSDFELIPLEFVELQPVDLQDMDVPEMEFEQDQFVIRVDDLTTEDI